MGRDSPRRPATPARTPETPRPPTPLYPGDPRPPSGPPALPQPTRQLPPNPATPSPLTAGSPNPGDPRPPSGMPPKPATPPRPGAPPAPHPASLPQSTFPRRASRSAAGPEVGLPPTLRCRSSDPCPPSGSRPGMYLFTSPHPRDVRDPVPGGPHSPALRLAPRPPAPARRAVREKGAPIRGPRAYPLGGQGARGAGGRVTPPFRRCPRCPRGRRGRCGAASAGWAPFEVPALLCGDSRCGGGGCAALPLGLRGPGAQDPAGPPSWLRATGRAGARPSANSIPCVGRERRGPRGRPRAARAACRCHPSPGRTRTALCCEGPSGPCHTTQKTLGGLSSCPGGKMEGWGQEPCAGARSQTPALSPAACSCTCPPHPYSPCLLPPPFLTLPFF